MNAIKAIFNKQLADLPKNMSVTIMFIMFPMMSFLLGNLMAGGDPVGQMAINIQFMMMFAGMTPMVMIGNTIAEDNEYKSLRFMVTAGVKPAQYLIGLISFALIASLFPIVAFAIIGGITGTEMLIFIGFGLMGALASSVLGAIVGLFSKNVQQGSAIYTPLGMVLAFAPFLANAGGALRDIFYPLFTVQIFITLIDRIMPEYVINFVREPGELTGEYVLEYLEPASSGMATSLGIIIANGVVFAILFVIAYRRKGLKG